MTQQTAYSRHFWGTVVFLLLAGLPPAQPAHAGQLGHYFPGGFNVRDYTLPDKGVSAAVYGIYYDSTSLRDASRNEISFVSIAGRTSPWTPT